ncbi:hypothetical protein ADK51_29135 [Streptomyces sp. WM6368]|nr:hypothetical protein ADK51_29135 [Streptomyces sp. WM6368]
MGQPFPLLPPLSCGLAGSHRKGTAPPRGAGPTGKPPSERLTAPRRDTPHHEHHAHLPGRRGRRPRPRPRQPGRRLRRPADRGEAAGRRPERRHELAVTAPRGRPRAAGP